MFLLGVYRTYSLESSYSRAIVGDFWNLFYLRLFSFRYFVATNYLTVELLVIIFDPFNLDGLLRIIDDGL